MNEGSLFDILHTDKDLEGRKWIMENLNVKLWIIEGIAHGMNYLHEK